MKEYLLRYTGELKPFKVREEHPKSILHFKSPVAYWRHTAVDHCTGCKSCGYHYREHHTNELPRTAFESCTKCLILKHIQEGKYMRNIGIFGENIFLCKYSEYAYFN